MPLPNGHDALASRLALIDAATRSVDARNITSGTTTPRGCCPGRAGPRRETWCAVRLLLDDNGVPGLDPFWRR